VYLSIKFRPELESGRNIIAYQFLGASGIMSAAIRYARTPNPAKTTSSARIRRMMVASISKYSARPPHTPKIFLLVLDL
jgi:hypothetical protein